MELPVVLEDDYFQMLSNIKAIGALKKESGLFACGKTCDLVDLSPRYGHVILVSRYLLLTGVNCS